MGFLPCLTLTFINNFPRSLFSGTHTRDKWVMPDWQSDFGLLFSGRGIPARGFLGEKPFPRENTKARKRGGKHLLRLMAILKQLTGRFLVFAPNDKKKFFLLLSSRCACEESCVKEKSRNASSYKLQIPVRKFRQMKESKHQICWTLKTKTRKADGSEAASVRRIITSGFLTLLIYRWCRIMMMETITFLLSWWDQYCSRGVCDKWWRALRLLAGRARARRGGWRRGGGGESEIDNLLSLVK